MPNRCRNIVKGPDQSTLGGGLGFPRHKLSPHLFRAKWEFAVRRLNGAKRTRSLAALPRDLSEFSSPEN